MQLQQYPCGCKGLPIEPNTNTAMILDACATHTKGGDIVELAGDATGTGGTPLDDDSSYLWAISSSIRDGQKWRTLRALLQG